MNDRYGQAILCSLAPNNFFDFYELEATAISAPKHRRGSEGENSDEQASSEIRSNYLELEEKLEIARELRNVEEEAHVQSLLVALGSRLAAAVGLSGRQREDGNEDELARKRVSNAIDRSIKKNARFHPGLADHLTCWIMKGATFRYVPDKQ